MIKNIIFDFDGTIADSMDAILDVVNEKADKYGYERLSGSKVRFFMGKGAQYLLSNIKISKIKIPFLIRDIKNEVNKQIVNIKPFSGIKMTLKKLNEKGFNLGILTTNSKENVELFLKKNNLDYFTFIYHGSSLFRKDKLLNLMIKEQNLKKEESVYIGDEDRDVEASKKVGLISVSVTWGFNSKSLLKSVRPDYIVNTPKELLDMLRNT